MCLTGTGYRKSIVFEGLAAMQEKAVIVICPLKALERDQVSKIKFSLWNSHLTSNEGCAGARETVACRRHQRRYRQDTFDLGRRYGWKMTTCVHLTGDGSFAIVRSTLGQYHVSREDLSNHCRRSSLRR